MHLLLLFLPFFRVAGSYEITGPNAVRGLVGGSLTVECCYASTWKTYSKWWCRGSIWRRCNILVQTTGSEQKVKKNKVSIRDNQKNFTFSVTMEELTETDTDIYWCGIEKSGTDLGVEVKVTIDPVIVQCHYGPGWETFVKSWCPDADLNSCAILVQTTGSQLKKNQLSIDQKKQTFSMAIWGE